MLMCPGIPEEKASILFDFAYWNQKKKDFSAPQTGTTNEEKDAKQGNAAVNLAMFSNIIDCEKNNEEDKLQIDFDNPRLKMAIKHIVYFSEIYPRKHKDKFQNIYEQITN